MLNCFCLADCSESPLESCGVEVRCCCKLHVLLLLYTGCSLRVAIYTNQNSISLNNTSPSTWETIYFIVETFCQPWFLTEFSWFVIFNVMSLIRIWFCLSCRTIYAETLSICCTWSEFAFSWWKTSKLWHSGMRYTPVNTKIVASCILLAACMTDYKRQSTMIVRINTLNYTNQIMKHLFRNIFQSAV